MSGTVHISSAIITHPARRASAELLRDQQPGLDALVVVDPNPKGPPGAQRSARLAWAAVAPHATHHLVMEDDVVLTSEYVDELYRAVAARPSDALSFFSEWGSRSTQAARIAALAGAPWVEVMADYLPTQALVLPAHLAHGFAAFLTEKTTDYEHTDAAAHRYLSAAGVDMLVAVPNIVDHRDMRSLLQGHDIWGPRPSGCYIPDPADRRDFSDWTGPVLRPTVVPYLPRAQYGQRPLCLVRSAPSQAWESLPAVEFLLSQGVEPDLLLSDLMAALASVPRGEVLTAEVGLGLLHDLWVVSYIIGVAVAQTVPGIGGVALYQAMSTSVARTLLATLAGGALRDRLEAETLARLSPEFEVLVRRAVVCAAQRGLGGSSDGG